MPNYVDTHLRILVPTEAKDDLLADISGPEEWLCPAAANSSYPGLEARLSNHDRLSLLANSEAHIAAVRESDAWAGAPEWMPVSREDVILLLTGQIEAPKIVPFSIPRLSPIATPEEFEAFFPGEIKDGYWCTGERDPDYRSGKLGLYALHMSRVGVKWSPGNVEITDQHDHDGSSIIEIRYTTPWGPVASLDTVLSPVLEKHGARAQAVWVEEQGYTGLVYLDPASGTVTDIDFGDDAMVRGDDVGEDDDFPVFSPEKLDELVELHLGENAI